MMELNDDLRGRVIMWLGALANEHEGEPIADTIRETCALLEAEAARLRDADDRQAAREGPASA